MISQTAEYALRAVVCLASEPGRRWTVPEVAERTHVPAGYLSKVLQALGRGGLVRSRRGLGGGFELGRPAAAITILEIVDVVDPLERIQCCPLGHAAHRAQLCPLHRRLDEAVAQARAAFGASTVAELLAEPGAVAPLCDGTSGGAGGCRQPAPGS